MEQVECQEVHLGVLGVEARRVKVLPLRKWTKSQTALEALFNVLYVLCTVIVFCQFVKSFCTLHKIV